MNELLGAYALGHLDDAEARAVERHLSTCEVCRAELQDVEPVAARLRELSAETDTGATGARWPSVDRRRRRAPAALAAALAAAAVVVSLGVGGLLGRASAPSEGPGAPVEAVALGTTPSATTSAPEVTDAGLIAHTWGVELLMSGSGFRAGDVYSVRFRSETGAWQPAGEFIGTGGDELDCQMQSGLLREDAVAVQVLDEDGRPVLAADL
ncbi:zf-HC2 domain-containing protein [Nocardioidaceae bacterium]|nr:zf-HC2 domain-containing protein [Nocardioidaceae bacterium]